MDRGTSRRQARADGRFNALSLRNILLGAFLISIQVSVGTDAKLQLPPSHLLDRRTLPDEHSKPFIVSNAFIAEFKTVPGNLNEVENEHDIFRTAIKDGQFEIRERLALKSLLNAISFEATTETANRIAKLPMIKSVWPMVAQNRPRVQVHSVPNVQGLKFAHAMTGVDRVRQRLQKAGEGVKVGVVDSGIDYMHPALGGCFGPGCRVALGWDLVGDDYTGNGRNQPIPDADPRDVCNGHGTHVAGIIGANDPSFQGVAPEVTLGAYRVFGCKGSSETDVVIAGMERAHQDGMQVINMSLGGGSSWSEYPDAAAAERLAQLGVVVVASMGNDGDKGMWEASSPGLAPSVISVGSVDSMRYQAFGLRVDNENLPPMEYLSDKETPLELKSVPITLIQSSSDPNGLGCDRLSNRIAGKLVMMQRGNCTFNIKATNAKEAGAIGVLVYNNMPDDVFIPSVTIPNSIPVVGLSQLNGQRIQQLLERKDEVTITFPNSLLTFDNPNGGHMSRFSSYGPGPELEVKPDVTAPGGLIRSTYPLPMGGYRTLSGTSMSSPYVAGAAALYISAKGKISNAPAEIRQMFQITAKAITQNNQADSGLTSIVRQGAGLLDIDAAISATTRITPSRIGLNDSRHGNLINEEFGPHTVTVTISNTQSIPVDYTMYHAPSLAIQGYIEGRALKKPDVLGSYASVTIDKSEDGLLDEASDKNNERIGGTVRRIVRSNSNPVLDGESTSSNSIQQQSKPTLDDETFVQEMGLDKSEDMTDGSDKAISQANNAGSFMFKFTVSANSEADITMNIRPPNLPEADRWIYSGFFNIYGSNRDALHVPYMGLSGNLHAQSILDRNGFPYLTRLVTEPGVGKVKHNDNHRERHTQVPHTTSKKYSEFELSEQEDELDAEMAESDDFDTEDIFDQEEQETRMGFSIDSKEANNTVISDNPSVIQQDTRSSRLRLRVRLTHPTRVLRVDVLKMDINDPQRIPTNPSGSTIGILPNAWITYLGRHSDDTDDFSTDFTFDGTYTPLGMASKTLFTPNQQSGFTLSKGIADAERNTSRITTLPDGYYRLKVVALLPFGNENQPSDWDVWNSPLLRLSTLSNNGTGPQAPRTSPYDAADGMLEYNRQVSIIKPARSVLSMALERQFQRVQNFKQPVKKDKNSNSKSWNGHVPI